MTREELDEMISLLSTTNNIIQIEYCHKAINLYIIHNLKHVKQDVVLHRRLKKWNLRVYVRLAELQSGTEMPHTAKTLIDISHILQELENSKADG